MDFYLQSAEQVLGALRTTRQGITSLEAKRRLTQYGRNVLRHKDTHPNIKIFIRQFKNIFFILLFFASVVSFSLGEFQQLAILIMVIVANIMVGFLEEYKAEKAKEKLEKSFTSYIYCYRDGRLVKISIEELVIGDVILIQAGDKVPSDIRLIVNSGLQIDESVLTGESVPAIKNIEQMISPRLVADQTNMAFATTNVLTGKGQGVVVAVSNSTEFGKIANLVETSRVVQTPLEKKMAQLAKLLLAIVSIIGVMIFILGYIRHDMPVGELLTFVIALLVSAVPESLPTIIVLTLAVGVLKMAQSKSIVKRLSVVETLGDIDVIATDKTGTLTKNEMTVNKAVWLNGKKLFYLDFPGAGYDIKQKARIVSDSLFYDLMNTGCVGNDASLLPQPKSPTEFTITGDPTEAAVLVAGLKANINFQKIREQNIRVDEIVFDPSYKYRAVLTDKQEIFVTGAFELLLEKSNLDPKVKQKVLNYATQLGNQGYRLLAMAKKKTQLKLLSHQDLNNLTFQGFVTMIDPVREGVKEALQQVGQSGVQIKIITGDYLHTARTVANQLGITIEDHEILVGSQIQKMSQRGLENKVEVVKLFARITPEQKLQIIQALQERGKVVAVTGDGVNDAPALRQAEVGIAMGMRGTDVAKEVADLILLDDSFATIVKSVGYGRNILANIKKSITFLLASNFDELFLVAAVFMAGLFLPGGLPAPFLAVQILWINMVIDTFVALALSFEDPKENLNIDIDKKDAGFLPPVIRRAAFIAMVSFGIQLIIFIEKLSNGIDTARTFVFFISVFFQLMVVFSVRSAKPFWQENIFNNVKLNIAVIFSVVLQFITIAPGVREFFGTVELSLWDFGVIIGACITGFMIIEISKLVKLKF